jgi:hypothetical protein
MARASGGLGLRHRLDCCACLGRFVGVRIGDVVFNGLELFLGLGNNQVGKLLRTCDLGRGIDGIAVCYTGI